MIRSYTESSIKHLRLNRSETMAACESFMKPRAKLVRGPGTTERPVIGYI